MRKHGWELPYHPLQVVAIAVFLALAFAFYVFFVPFVGRKLFEYIVIGCFSPLVTSVFGLYIWCAATDPGDPGVFRSKKYGKIPDLTKGSSFKEPLPGSGVSVSDTNTETAGEKLQPEGPSVIASAIKESSSNLEQKKTGWKDLFILICAWFPLTWILNSSCSSKQSSEQHMCEDDILYCSLCEVEVFKYSKHCRVCDKCVDGFDHHCRWLNNCIGRKNYKGFFALMVSALLLLILQWSIGILVLVCCFLNRRRFDVEIISKLGSSFSLVPFIVVVGSCTVLAMVATLPLAQLFFFHVLLIKKGISTYDYIIAMREQEQQTMGGAQSPQMSPASSATGMSSASSASALHRGAWCTPPRLFLEDQFTVLPPEGATSSIETGNRGAKRTSGERMGRKNNVVKISPWTLARLNAEEVSKTASQARKKSKVLQPISRQEGALGVDTDSSLASSSRDRSTGITLQPDNRRRSYRRARPQSPLKSFPFTRPLRPAKVPLKSQAKSEHLCEYDDVDINHTIGESSSRLAPLQFEARNVFRSSLAGASIGVIGSSPESSLASPDIQPFRESTSGIHDISGLTAAPSSFPKGLRLLRSTSDGYEASAGESPDDSDHATARLQKLNWNNLLFNPTYTDKNPATESLSNRLSLFPYRESKLKSTSQVKGLRMQVSNEKGVIRKSPEGSHSTEKTNYSPSRYDSPEKDSDSFSSKQHKDKFIKNGDTA